jgi:hypothetical protein
MSTGKMHFIDDGDWMRGGDWLTIDGSGWDLSIELTCSEGHIRIIVKRDRSDRAVTLADVELPNELAVDVAEAIQLLDGSE